MSASPADSPRERGGQARLIASGSLAQQASQVAGLVALFAIITVLARRLTLEEFGIYGLLTSLAGYLLVIQGAASSAAVRTMAAATDPADRDRAFSTAVLVYVAAGLVSGVVIAVVGFVLALTVDLPASVEHDARIGAVLLGLVTALGWPITVYRDTLRAHQLFVTAALIEVMSLAAFAALVLALAFADAGLALLIAAGGTIPLLAGAGCWVAVRRRSLPERFRRGSTTRARLGEFARLAGYVSLSEAAATAIYVVDRVLLGLFKSAATVGLYEGPVRAHNLIRALNSAGTLTSLSSSARYFAQDDRPRLAALLTRGMRYTLALAVPLAVTGMVLAPPLLEVWLGHSFRQGGLTMAILLSYWLVYGCTGVLQGILVGGERAQALARIAWAVALANLVLAVALIPLLGLEGVAVATAVPYFVAFPFLLGAVRRLVPVSVAEIARHALLPAYSLGAGLALLLAGARLVWGLDELAPVAAAALGGLALYWAAYYVVWLTADERRLVHDVALRRRHA